MSGAARTVTLKEVCSSVQYGYTASAGPDPIGPKFLRITDIVPDSLDWSEVPYCEADAKSVRKFGLATGDIVVARTGATVGYAKLVKSPPEAVFASYLVRFRVKEGVDPGYIGSIVQSEAYKQWVRSQAGGSAQPNANAQVLGAYELPLPPLETQQRIAAILGAYDDLIEVNRRRVAVLEEMARGLFEEWFVRFRFPGHEDVPMVATPDGPLPQGWSVSPLGSVLRLHYGKALKAETRVPGDVSVIGSSGVVGSHTSHLVEGPGIVVGRKGNVGSVIWSTNDFWPIDTAYFVETGLPLTFVYELLRRIPFENTDAAVPGLNRDYALSRLVVLPDAALIERYGRFAVPLRQQLDVLQQANYILAASRDLLLPRLISGQLSVEAAERELENAA